MSAILIAHRGKGDVAAVRHSGLAYKIAAGDLKIGQVGDVAYIHGFGKQAAADGKRGVTFFGDNLAVKQAVFDGDGGVIIREGHILFKGSTLDLGLRAGGGVYPDSFLKGAAGDGAVVAHIPLEGAVGDDFVVVHPPLEDAAGDGALVVGSFADGAAVKFGIFNNIESCLQCAYSLGLRGGLQGKDAIVQPTTGVSAV